MFQFIWYTFIGKTEKFEETGCLCVAKWIERLETLPETENRIQELFSRSPQKSTYHAIAEQQVPQSNVWCILPKRLVFKPYHLLISTSWSNG